MNNSRRKRISKIADALNELKGQIDELYEEEPSGMRLRRMRSICSNLHL